MDIKEKEITESDKKQKLTNRAVIISLSVLCLLLFAFFIGTRIIEKNAPADITIYTNEPTEFTSSFNLPLNINTAPFSELNELPGIGEKRAEDIIKYRKEHGPYKSKEDILNVEGIGDGILKDIYDLITVE